MELKEQIKETKARRKGFLKAMPEEQRRLLRMRERAERGAKRAVVMIPILFVLLLAGYLALCLLVPYANNWVINGIFFGALFVLGTILLLVLRSSYRKKSKALASSIGDYIREYHEINQKIEDLKQADKDRAYAERKAAQAERKAQTAQVRAAEQIRKAEERAKASQQQAQAANDHAAAVAGAPAPAVTTPIQSIGTEAIAEAKQAEIAAGDIASTVSDEIEETALEAADAIDAEVSSAEIAEPVTEAIEAAALPTELEETAIQEPELPLDAKTEPVEVADEIL